MNKNTVKANTINESEVITMEKAMEQVKANNLQSFSAIVSADATKDNVKKAVELFNGLKKGERTEKNYKLISDMVITVNTTLKNNVVGKYALLNDTKLFKALCDVTVKFGEKDNALTKGKKIESAIAYDYIAAPYDEKDKTVTFKEGQKALKLADIFKAKTDLQAKKHTDENKKEDRKKALAEIVTDNIEGVLYCLLNSACEVKKYDTEVIKTNDNYNAMLSALDIYFKAHKKENPFRNTIKADGTENRRALESQLKTVAQVIFNNESYVDKIKKAHAENIIDLLVNTNNRTGVKVESKDVISIAQAFIIEMRYAYNGIVPPTQKNKTIHA